MYNNGQKPDTRIYCEPGSSMTKQADAAECDINNILAKVQKTGMIEHLAQGEPFYGDVTEMVDYQSAMNLINKANDLFMKMSPDIREKFENNPEKMITFLNNEANYDEAVKLGMVIDKRAKESATIETPENTNVQP